MTEEAQHEGGTGDNFFNENGGPSAKGAPSFKFKETGSLVRGKVVDTFQTFVTHVQDVKGTDIKKGDPKLDSKQRKQPQLNVTLQTSLRNWEDVARIPEDEDGKQLPPEEDTGLRRIYVKHRMITAIREALEAAKAPGLKLQKGGDLAVKKTGEEDIGQMNGLPLYAAKYAAPEPGEDFFTEESKTEAPKSEEKAAETQPAKSSDEPPW